MLNAEKHRKLKVSRRLSIFIFQLWELYQEKRDYLQLFATFRLSDSNYLHTSELIHILKLLAHVFDDKNVCDICFESSASSIINLVYEIHANSKIFPPNPNIL